MKHSDEMLALLLDSGALDGEIEEMWANVAPSEDRFEELLPFVLFNDAPNKSEVITYILNNREHFRQEEVCEMTE